MRSEVQATVLEINYWSTSLREVETPLLFITVELILWKELCIWTCNAWVPGRPSQLRHDLGQVTSFSSAGPHLKNEAWDRMSSHALLKSVFRSLCHVTFISSILLHFLLNRVLLWPKAGWLRIRSSPLGQLISGWVQPIGGTEPLWKAVRKGETKAFLLPSAFGGVSCRSLIHLFLSSSSYFLEGSCDPASFLCSSS